MKHVITCGPCLYNSIGRLLLSDSKIVIIGNNVMLECHLLKWQLMLQCSSIFLSSKLNNFFARLLKLCVYF